MSGAPVDDQSRNSATNLFTGVDIAWGWLVAQSTFTRRALHAAAVRHARQRRLQESQSSANSARLSNDRVARPVGVARTHCDHAASGRTRRPGPAAATQAQAADRPAPRVRVQCQPEAAVNPARSELAWPLAKPGFSTTTNPFVFTAAAISFARRPEHQRSSRKRRVAHEIQVRSSKGRPRKRQQLLGMAEARRAAASQHDDRSRRRTHDGLAGTLTSSMAPRPQRCADRVHVGQR